jgi:hypothetical protein
VRIYLPNKVLEQHQTPNELINYVGAAPFAIKLPNNERNAKDRLENPKIRKRATPLHYHLLNFIMWRVPSDFFAIRKPGLHIKDGELVTRKNPRQQVEVSGSYFRFIKVKKNAQETPITL